MSEHQKRLNTKVVFRVESFLFAFNLRFSLGKFQHSPKQKIGLQSIQPNCTLSFSHVNIDFVRTVCPSFARSGIDRNGHRHFRTARYIDGTHVNIGRNIVCLNLVYHAFGGYNRYTQRFCRNRCIFGGI